MKECRHHFLLLFCQNVDGFVSFWSLCCHPEKPKLVKSMFSLSPVSRKHTKKKKETCSFPFHNRHKRNGTNVEGCSLSLSLSMPSIFEGAFAIFLFVKNQDTHTHTHGSRKCKKVKVCRACNSPRQPPSRQEEEDDEN
jgi:hypothetical protein